MKITLTEFQRALTNAEHARLAPIVRKHAEAGEHEVNPAHFEGDDVTDEQLDDARRACARIEADARGEQRLE